MGGYVSFMWTPEVILEYNCRGGYGDYITVETFKSYFYSLFFGGVSGKNELWVMEKHLIPASHQKLLKLIGSELFSHFGKGGKFRRILLLMLNFVHNFQYFPTSACDANKQN
jgi:hypothetical protein